MSNGDLRNFCGRDSLPYCCCICQRAFHSHQKFISHFQKHMALNQVTTCNICHSKFLPVAFQEHMAQHAEERGYCSACGFAKYSFKRKPGCVLWLEEHQCIFSSCENQESDQVIRCSLCNDGKSFKIGRMTHIHANLHKATNLYPCSLCDLVFTYRSERILHVTQVHVTHKRFSKNFSLPCHFCGRRFSSLSLAKVHNKFCSVIKQPLFCDLCRQTFSDKRSLRNHNRSYHRKEFSCDTCLTVFLDSIDLAEHVKKKHKKGVNCKFACLECGIECQNKPNLISHMRVKHPSSILVQEALGSIDNISRRLACDYCSDSFVGTVDMFLHYFTQHKGEKISCSLIQNLGRFCPLCSKECQDTEAMRNHLDLRHAVITSGDQLDETQNMRLHCPNCKTKNWHNLVLHVFYTHGGIDAPEEVFKDKSAGICPICRSDTSDMRSHLSEVHKMKSITDRSKDE